eukprot:8340957-Pyramimonas_sp.AAC.1
MRNARLDLRVLGEDVGHFAMEPKQLRGRGRAVSLSDRMWDNSGHGHLGCKCRCKVNVTLAFLFACFRTFV